MSDTRRRCAWCSADPLYIDYHDREWGVPLHDERALFELLCLEGQQAGLSWLTVLRKRERYRERFHGFDIDRVAALSDAELDEIVRDPGVIRHRGKLEAIRRNARAAQSLRTLPGGFAGWLWRFAPPARAHAPGRAEVPTTTAQSDALSKALRQAGFGFVGSTICYAFMQASGMVDDHSADCWRAGAALAAAAD